MKHGIYFLALCLTIISCSAEEGTGSDESKASENQEMATISEVEFEEVKTFRPIDLDISNFGAFDFDEQGRMYIVSGRHIYVLDKEGEVVKRLGGSGRGPGEFDNMGALIPKLGSEKLFVYDDVLQAINIYDTNSLEFERLMHLDPQKRQHIQELRSARFVKFYVIRDDLFLARFVEGTPMEGEDTRFTRYYLMDDTGDIVSDEIMKHPVSNEFSGQGIPGPVRRGDSDFPNQSTRSTLVHMSDNSTFYSLWNEDLIVIKRELPANSVDTLSYSVTPAELDETEIIEFYKHHWNAMYQTARRASYPDTWPEADQIITDDQERIWVSTITDDTEYYHWLIFDGETGSPVGTFKWPGKRIERSIKEQSIKKIKNGHLYAIEHDSVSNEEVIKKYEVKFES